MRKKDAATLADHPLKKNFKTLPVSCAVMKKLWNFLSNRHITSQMDELEVINVRIMNQYAFILSFAAICHAVFAFVILKTTHFYILGCFGVYIFLATLFTRIRFMRFHALIFSICLALAIFYYSAANGFDNGISLYYVVFLSATPIAAYDSYYRFRFIPVIFIIATVLLIVSNHYDFKIFSKYDTWAHSDNIRYIIILNTLLFSGINTYFIISKQQMIVFQYQKIKRAEILIANLKSELTDRSSKGTETNIPCIGQVVTLAINGDITFIPSFQLLFPNIHGKLLALNPQMTIDEFRFCALLKLGFSTKDISNYNNVTIRSVQTRKSRLRKSFGIPSDMDLYNWIDSI